MKGREGGRRERRGEWKGKGKGKGKGQEIKVKNRKVKLGLIDSMVMISYTDKSSPTTKREKAEIAHPYVAVIHLS